jgi:H+-translocating NAD(P) transhydrogenase subunit alpha
MLDENGTPAPDFSDEILAESCVTRSKETS